MFATACLTDRTKPSIWPPEDFLVRVSGTKLDARGQPVVQRFQVDRAGIAFYREADATVAEAPLVMPVFDRVVTYELRPESVRQFSRLLQSAKLLENDSAQMFNTGEGVEHVVVNWRAFGRAGQVSSRENSSGVLDRVVHIVNSYLPKGCAFAFPELSGEVEPPHVTRVPDPLEWAPGSIICHRKFTQLYPDDRNLWLDLFALAIVEGDAELAREVYEEVAERGPPPNVDDIMQIVDWREECLDAMRTLMVRLGD